MDKEPYRILLVEDNPDDIVLIEEMISDINYRYTGDSTYFIVETAKSNQLAQEYLNEHNVDVVLLDLTLPDSRGLETTRKWENYVLEIPVIVLTGFDDDRTATISIQRGMQDYLVKKMINSDALYKSIRYAIARQRMITLLFNMSMVDELTKLYNRRGFYKLAEHDMNMAKRKGLWLSISFIDIDGMKDINDSFGHIEGDRALLDVADILRMTFRESDVIARIGGDEFAAVGLSDNPIDAKVLKERLNQCANKLLEQEKRPYRLSLSIGVASHFSNQLFNLEKLMLEADQFMYQDKQQRDKLTILR